MEKYQELVDQLIEQKYLVTPRIINAFKKTPRKDFLLPKDAPLESLNAPIPIGEGQTISQPLTVAFILNLLQPEPGDKVLDIGYGSGWQTALLSRIICPKGKKKCGKVIAYEIIPELAKFGKKNLVNTLPKRLISRITIHSKDYRTTFQNHAPFDRIISAAAFKEIPKELINALSVGGIMVYPTHANDIRKITREDEEKYTEEIFPGFIFVPITH